jgi:hypothetical protein
MFFINVRDQDSLAYKEQTNYIISTLGYLTTFLENMYLDRVLLHWKRIRNGAALVNLKFIFRHTTGATEETCETSVLTICTLVQNLKGDRHKYLSLRFHKPIEMGHTDKYISWLFHKPI